MIANKLITTLENHMNELAKIWFEESRKCKYLKTYSTFKDNEVQDRGEKVYEHLLTWLKAGADTKDAEKYFERIGAERFDENFLLPEVHYAVYLTKKVFWNFIDWRDAITGAFESANAKDIMTIINNYFDLGNFHITIGYFNKLLETMDDNQTISKKGLQNILIKGYENLEDLEEEDIIWRPV